MSLGLLALVAVEVAPVLAPSCSSGQECRVSLSAGQVFDAAQRLAVSGELDQAVALLKVITNDNNPDYRAEARVRIARIEAARGNRAEALYWYRALLDEKPDAAGVRIEVAQLLAAAGNEDAARDELRRAEAIGLPAETQRFVYRAVSALRNQKAVTLDGSIGFAPDSNISSQTSAETFTIFNLPFKLDNDARARSGLGLSYSGQITIRRPSSGSTRLITHISAVGSLYRDNRFNDTSILIDTGPDLAIGSARVRPAVTLGQRIFGVDRLYRLFGPSLLVQAASGRRSTVSLNVSAIRYDYEIQRANQSGWVQSANVAIDRAVTASLAVRASVSYARVGAKDPSFASRNVSIDAAMSRDLGRFTLYARGAFTKMRGDSAFLFFPDRRDDRIYEANGAVQFRGLHFLGLSPQIKMTYQKSDSSIPIFQFNRIRGEVGLTSLF